MRGVDLNVFDFDYDLTWAAFFMNSENYVYGRYGSRDEGSAEAGLSLKGLKYAMQQALNAYKKTPRAKSEIKHAERRGLPAKIENYPAAARVKKDACFHCHQVHNFQHDLFLSKKSWNKDRMWIFPPPKTIGLEMDIDQGNKIAAVTPETSAEKSGLQPGDVLQKLNRIAIASGADIQYALQNAPQQGTINAAWTRNDRTMSGTIELFQGWRISDISWRGSMWSMPPAMGIYGRDLTSAEKAKLGLGKDRLAFSQGNYVPPKPKQAGIRAKDIIIGVDGKPLKMTMLQFNVYMRTNYNVGDKVTFNLFRKGKRIKVPMTLPRHPRN